MAGRITVDADNRLVIWGFDGLTGAGEGVSYSADLINGPDRSKKLTRLVLDGTWGLTPEYDLALHVIGSNYDELSGKTIIFRGEIEHAEGNTLGFRVRDYENVLGIHSGSITLKGKWKADKYNCITFEAAKGQGRYDTLTLKGAWQVNRNNEIIYIYKKTCLKTRIKEDRLIIFRGYWDIGKGTLTYRFEHSFDSCFVFKADFKTRRLKISDREIKFNVGFTLQKKNSRTKAVHVITIRGGWEVRGGLKTVFSVAYSGSRRRTIEFGVEELIGNNTKAVISLTAKTGEPLGVELELTKKFKNTAELFLELSRSKKECRIMGGMRVRF